MFSFRFGNREPPACLLGWKFRLPKKTDGRTEFNLEIPGPGGCDGWNLFQQAKV